MYYVFNIKGRDGRAIGSEDMKDFLRRGKKSRARASGLLVSSSEDESTQSPTQQVSST